ncbi:MAG: class I SAM-dependent methyltransferase [Gaiellaceae bacterium]
MSAPAVWWGEGTYERLAERLAPVHDELVEALEPRAGEEWLDAATGTGEVALRAARAGARVTAFDFSPTMLEKAEGRLDGLDVRLDEADAREVPYGDASFDVVASCFGVIFPPERERVAGELGRVCRPGGRLGITGWLPDEELNEAWSPFIGSKPLPLDAWGDPAEVERLLGEDYELEIERKTWLLTGSDGADIWAFLSSSAPPIRVLLAVVGEEVGTQLRDAYVEVAEQHRSDDGVRYPMEYLLVLGRRR